MVRPHERVEALGEEGTLAAGEDPAGDATLPPALRDALAAIPLRVAGDCRATATTAAASVVLPLSDPRETDGTYTASDGRVQTLRRVAPPLDGVGTAVTIERLAARLGIGGAR